MKTFLISAAVTMLVTALPVLAQDNVPESMRIDQKADREFYQNKNSTTAPTTNAGSTGDQKRLDVQAPSPNQLQIDDGTSGSLQRNPDAVDRTRAGDTYNNVLEKQPSTNSVTPGSGSATGGVQPLPPPTGAMRPSVTQPSGTSGGGTGASSGSTGIGGGSGARGGGTSSGGGSSSGGGR
jgi:hypothetical protein